MRSSSYWRKLTAQTQGSDERRADVFISHSRKDKDFVRRLADALAKDEREAWVDVEAILPTEDWLAKVYTGIEGSDALVFVISPDSVKVGYYTLQPMAAPGELR